jgi:hypothetical protein
MTKREKIIVGVMCVAIVYGAYELLGTRGSKKSTAPAATTKVNPEDETRKFVTDMTQKLVAERMRTEDQHAVNQASSEWTKDPFIQSTAPLESKSSGSAPPKQPNDVSIAAPAFAFTGFLQMGDMQLAIINGLEYAVGDTIGTNGHYVESISPEGVVIGTTDGEKIQLPLSEID